MTVKCVKCDRHCLKVDVQAHVVGKFCPSCRTLYTTNDDLTVTHLKYGPRDLIDALQLTNKQTEGEHLTYKQYRENKLKGSPSANTIRKRFGSWSKAIQAAQIPPKKTYDKEEIIKHLKRASVDGVLSKKKYKEYRQLDAVTDAPSHSTINRKFGSFSTACGEAAVVPGGTQR